MKKLFHDVPEAIKNIQEVVDKVEAFQLAHEMYYYLPLIFQKNLNMVKIWPMAESEEKMII